MKTLLLSFVLSLIAALQAQDLLAWEEEEDVSGKWYLKVTASNQEISGKNLGAVSVTPMTITSLEGGSLEVNFTVLVAGHCQEVSIILEKTEEPGKYTAYEGKHVVRIIKSLVEDHYIFYGVAKLPGEQIRVANLVGRDPEISLETLEDFEKATGARGLNTENISIPKQIETCSPESE